VNRERERDEIGERCVYRSVIGGPPTIWGWVPPLGREIDRVFGWRAAGAERSHPRFGDGSNNPSHVWLKKLGWSGSDPIFCLVGGTRYGMDGSFHSVSRSHMSLGLRFSGFPHVIIILFILMPRPSIRSPA
jgi:hypothetical protein